MRINFYATLRKPAGGKSIEVELTPATTACTALEAATRTRPDLAEEIWQAPGKVKEHIHVFINGRQSIFLPQGLETLITEDDVVDVFPPVGGGSIPSQASG